MPRPRNAHPTPAELEILKVLWERGPLTVRGVLAGLGGERPRAYTTVMTLLNVMHDKKLVRREAKGKAFVYRAAVRRERALGAMLADIVRRGFEGSASALVARLLDQARPSRQEMQEIRRVIEEHGREGPGSRAEGMRPSIKGRPTD